MIAFRYLCSIPIVVLGVVLGCAASAQNIGDIKDAQLAEISTLPNMIETEEADTDYVIAPIPMSNPTIGSGLGLAGAYLYTIGETVEPSFTGVGGFRTSSGSWGAGLGQSTRFGDGKYRIDAFAGFASVRYDFFGVGKAAGDRGAVLPIEQEGAAVAAIASAEVFDDIFVGLKARYLDSTTRIRLDDVSQAPVTIPPLEIEVTSGVAGLVLDIDKRDQRFNPRDGYLVSGEFLHSFAERSSVLEFRKATVNSDLFLPAGEEDALALRLSLCNVSGRSPFFELCMLGGTDAFRGYPTGRYRDRSLISTQVEYRGRLWKKFGYVIFGGFGGVARDFGDFDADAFLPAVGVGVRYRVSEKFEVDFSVDGAWGRDSSAIYVYLGQAF